VNILDKINGHTDLLLLNEEERICLCQQIRNFLIDSISKTGGHLASNLGVVELTVAIETVFDTDKDRLVFDVGHQSYVHKLLTGRREGFQSLRQFDGMAGFPKPSESNSDAFTAGHSSSSVSIALGMARARTLSQEDYNVVVLLGDGAATGGMIYEGLNDAAVSNEPMIVILNDNEMSIDNNVGGMASHLSKLRTKEKYLGMKRHYKSVLSTLPGGNAILNFTRSIKDRIRRMLIPETIFECMGFTYLGPVDGHDTENLIALLRIAKEMKRPVLLHVLTQKGKGYEPAQTQPKLFHGVGKFDPVTGKVPEKTEKTFSDIFGSTLCDLAAQNDKICAITAAMPGGTGLLDFKQSFPKRMFDVGIAEEHAMSMAGGLAKQGMIPVVALYSTFLQRSYDMILQDVCMQNLHVVLAVDRAGLVGEDGETHHGVFDVGFLRQAPNMTVLCPASCAELADMLRWAVNECSGPVAIRYPRGTDGHFTHAQWSADDMVIEHCVGSDCAIVTYGTLVNNAIDASDILNKLGISAKVIRLSCIDPLPADSLCAVLTGCRYVLIIEETCDDCGIYGSVSWKLQRKMPGCIFDHIDLRDQFPTHGSMEKLYEHYGLDAESIAKHIQEVLKVEN
jgi:1-deoxy-D-xylulose-5-phosphate synthase